MSIPSAAPSSALAAPEVDAETAQAWIDAGEAILIDVRETAEYDFENVPGALLLPLTYFQADRFPSIPGRKLIFMCAMGRRSASAAQQILEAKKGDAYSLSGGIEAWKAQGLPVQGMADDGNDYTI